ncbi:hypothetical protein [Tsukamurella soli]|uniref:Uncharacterized protein n=1 Tax=Tsukamurella soli TaxID=644556 RepID=A0ABP8K3W2_9ACTN
MLGYRMFVGAADEPELLRLTNGQLSEWLIEKRWTDDHPVDGHAVGVAPNVRATVVSHTHQKGGVTRRHRFVEQNSGATWVTELTVHQGQGGKTGWVWLDVIGPDRGATPRPPRLARKLIEVVYAHDGDHLVEATPTIIDIDDVPGACQVFCVSS